MADHHICLMNNNGGGINDHTCLMNNNGGGTDDHTRLMNNNGGGTDDHICLMNNNGGGINDHTCSMNNNGGGTDDHTRLMNNNGGGTDDNTCLMNNNGGGTDDNTCLMNNNGGGINDHTRLMNNNGGGREISKSTISLTFPKTGWTRGDYEEPRSPLTTGGPAESPDSEDYESLLLHNGQGRRTSEIRQESCVSINGHNSPNGSFVTVTDSTRSDGFNYEQLKVADTVIKQWKVQRFYINTILSANVILFIILMTFVLAVLAGCPCIRATWQAKATPTANKPTSLCMPCDDLEVSLRVAKLPDWITNSSGSCCLESLVDILKLLNNKVEEKISNEISHAIKLLEHAVHSRNNKSETPTRSRSLFAHVIADMKPRHIQSSSNSGGPLPVKIPKFYVGANSRVWGAGIEIQYNRLFIPENGLYLVYSQVQFSESLTTYRPAPDEKMRSQSPSSQILTHKVCRYDVNLPNDQEELLMKTSVSKYGLKNNQPVFQHSTYLSGVFILASGDQIYVRVSDESLVDLEGISTYFGAFKLADG